jgi:hypothetical protein
MYKKRRAADIYGMLQQGGCDSNMRKSKQHLRENLFFFHPFFPPMCGCFFSA